MAPKRMPAAARLTHVDAKGRARMVDVGGKPATERVAVAHAEVRGAKATIRAIRDNTLKKGDVLTTAEIAGIQAAKRTSELIPLCHPVALSHVEVSCKPLLSKAVIQIVATARCTGETGVEMEALTAAAVAALTVYDMAKAADRGMVIGEVRLEEKRGGKSGAWRRGEERAR